MDTFCRIVSGELPSFKIYEDRNFIAILDIYPNIRGQTVIISKRHSTGYVFDLPDGELRTLITTVKRVALLLEKRLKVKRVHIVMEGTGINHLHVKLYPAVGLQDKYKAVTAKGSVNFGRYPGYVSTLSGPKADMVKLERLAKRIKYLHRF